MDLAYNITFFEFMLIAFEFMLIAFEFDTVLKKNRHSFFEYT